MKDKKNPNMDDYGLAPDSLEPHLGMMSKKFSSVNSKCSANGEVFHCSSNDKIEDFPYFNNHVKKSSRINNAPDCNIRTIDRRWANEDSSRRSIESPKLRSEQSRARIQPKGLHTHVLNCSGLRPNRRLTIAINNAFGNENVKERFEDDEMACKTNSLNIREKIHLYPHVCGKDDRNLPQLAESSTSSDQDFPVSRVHYKKKVHKNTRPKNTRKTRECCNRVCTDPNCTKITRDSEDSSIFSRSDSDSRQSSTNSRVQKVSISNSAEILYEESSSYKFIPPSENSVRPLKSALKMTNNKNTERNREHHRSTTDLSYNRFKRHSDDNYRKSFVINSHDSSKKNPGMFNNPRHRERRHFYHSTENLEDDVYDPSLPVIPLMIPKYNDNCKSTSSSISSNNKKSSSKSSTSSKSIYKKSNSVSSGRSGSTDLEEATTNSLRRNTLNNRKNLSSSKSMSKSMSNLSYMPTERTSDLASEISSDSVDDLTMVAPTLGNWHEALALTKSLGWTLMLYQAVRNNYKPLQFARQLIKGSRSYVRAVADYKTRESRLLSFNKGDIIRVTSSDHYQGKGWLEGSVDGQTGLFPMECVVPIGRAEARMSNKTADLEERDSDHRTSNGIVRSDRDRTNGHGSGGSTSSWGGERERPYHSAQNANKNTNHIHLHHHDDSGHSSGGEGGMGSGGERNIADGSVGSLTKSNNLHNRDASYQANDTMSVSQYSTQFANDGKHSLLQFALKYFRTSKEQNLVAADGTLQTNKDKSKKKKNSKDNSAASWTWKEQVEMVKFTQSPLSASLLPLDQEISYVAVEVIFLSVMRYMGDYPMEQGQTETHCVYNILSNCHKYEPLRDELYCQIMKQTTSNKSSIPDSCQRGWRLFSIVAAYFTCSDILKPYLFKYLETNAYDKRRAFHGTAMVTLQNLRKTFKHGGRKNVPSVDEITALTAGRNSKREMYRLPGGTERVINTRSTSVVQDILEELCHEISVTSPEEQEEFSMYCLVDGESFTMPLAKEEYILDVTTELRKNNQTFYLIFCRSVWYCPLRLDTPLYVEVVFNQIAPDYLEGLLLVAPGEKLPQHLIMDIAKVAALMHRAADLDLEPTMSEVKFLLPKQALVLQMVEPAQWVNMVQGAWPEASKLTTMQAKGQVLEILENWELFGSSFFTVKRMSEGQEPVETILALNKLGVHFLDYHTHETLEHYNLSQVFSTRKVKSEDGYLYLDMKFGNLLHHRISRIQTIQAHEISRLFRQYIMTEQRVSGGQEGDIPRDVTLSR